MRAINHYRDQCSCVFYILSPSNLTSAYLFIFPNSFLARLSSPGTTMLIGKHWFVFLSTLVISSYIVVEFYSSVSLYSEVQEDFLHACFTFSCFNFVATCINLRAILNIICHLHSAVNQTCKGQGWKRDQNNICCKRMLFTESIQMNHRFQLWSTFEGAKNNQNLQNF